MSYTTELKIKMLNKDNLRYLIAMKAGSPLLRRLSVIPDRHLDTLGHKYGYEIQRIKHAIMRDEWC